MATPLEEDEPVDGAAPGLTSQARGRRPSRYRQVAVGGALSDDELDKVFANGDDHALRLAYERYGTLVHTLCRRALDPATSAEVTQDVFVTIWRARERFDPDRGGLAAWLMTITRHKIVDQFRAEARRPHTTTLTASAFTAGADVPGPGWLGVGPSEVDAVADRLLLLDALTRLSPRARSVVELAFWSDLTQAQIAERCGLPLGTVKSDLRRSLVHLARHLRQTDGSGPSSRGSDATPGDHDG